VRKNQVEVGKRQPSLPPDLPPTLSRPHSVPAPPRPPGSPFWHRRHCVFSGRGGGGGCKERGARPPHNAALRPSATARWATTNKQVDAGPHITPRTAAPVNAALPVLDNDGTALPLSGLTAGVHPQHGRYTTRRSAPRGAERCRRTTPRYAPRPQRDGRPQTSRWTPAPTERRAQPRPSTLHFSACQRRDGPANKRPGSRRPPSTLQTPRPRPQAPT
jgi:hypothetical protein